MAASEVTQWTSRLNFASELARMTAELQEAVIKRTVRAKHPNYVEALEHVQSAVADLTKALAVLVAAPEGLREPPKPPVRPPAPGNTE